MAGQHIDGFPNLSPRGKLAGLALTKEVLKAAANTEAWFGGTPLELGASGVCRKYIVGTSLGIYGFSREQSDTSLPTGFASLPKMKDAAGAQRIQASMADSSTTFRQGGLKPGQTANVGDLVGLYTTNDAAGNAIWYWDTTATLKLGQIVEITPDSYGASQNAAVAGGKVDVEILPAKSQYMAGGIVPTAGF